MQRRAAGASTRLVGKGVTVCHVVNGCTKKETLTERTEGGAFLYLFSRFLLAAALGSPSASPAATISRGESQPSSASLLSGLGKAFVSVNSLENVMSY